MEIAISSSILLAGIALVSAMVPRIGRSWRECRNYQLATHELANQLELLTALDAKELDKSLSNLTVSEELQDELKDATLTAVTSHEEFGTRIRLEIQWDRGQDSDPLSMTGWHSGRSSER